MATYYTNSNHDEIVWLEDAQDYQYEWLMDSLEDNGDTELLNAIETGRESVLEAYYIERDDDGLWHIINPDWRPDFHVAESSHWEGQNLERTEEPFPTPVCENYECTYSECRYEN